MHSMEKPECKEASAGKRKAQKSSAYPYNTRCLY